jgi:hypothetical protein
LPSFSRQALPVAHSVPPFPQGSPEEAEKMMPVFKIQTNAKQKIILKKCVTVLCLK